MWIYEIDIKARLGCTLVRQGLLKDIATCSKQHETYLIFNRNIFSFMLIADVVQTKKKYYKSCWNLCVLWIVLIEGIAFRLSHVKTVLQHFDVPSFAKTYNFSSNTEEEKIQGTLSRSVIKPLIFLQQICKFC